MHFGFDCVPFPKLAWRTSRTNSCGPVPFEINSLRNISGRNFSRSMPTGLCSGLVHITPLPPFRGTNCISVVCARSHNMGRHVANPPGERPTKVRSYPTRISIGAEHTQITQYPPAISVGRWRRRRPRRCRPYLQTQIACNLLLMMRDKFGS